MSVDEADCVSDGESVADTLGDMVDVSDGEAVLLADSDDVCEGVLDCELDDVGERVDVRVWVRERVPVRVCVRDWVRERVPVRVCMGWGWGACGVVAWIGCTADFRASANLRPRLCPGLRARSRERACLRVGLRLARRGRRRLAG